MTTENRDFPTLPHTTTSVVKVGDAMGSVTDGLGNIWPEGVIAYAAPFSTTPVYAAPFTPSPWPPFTEPATEIPWPPLGVPNDARLALMENKLTEIFTVLTTLTNVLMEIRERLAVREAMEEMLKKLGK